MGRLGSGGSGGRGPRRRCRRDAVDSGSSGGGVVDGRRRRTATERSGEARCSGCSGEDNKVGTAAVDGEGSQNHVKQSLGVERSRNQEGGGSG
jgi:hypothetical protein